MGYGSTPASKPAIDPDDAAKIEAFEQECFVTGLRQQLEHAKDNRALPRTKDINFVWDWRRNSVTGSLGYVSPTPSRGNTPTSKTRSRSPEPEPPRINKVSSPAIRRSHECGSGEGSAPTRRAEALPMPTSKRKRDEDRIIAFMEADSDDEMILAAEAVMRKPKRRLINGFGEVKTARKAGKQRTRLDGLASPRNAAPGGSNSRRWLTAEEERGGALALEQSVRLQTRQAEMSLLARHKTATTEVISLCDHEQAPNEDSYLGAGVSDSHLEAEVERHIASGYAEIAELHCPPQQEFYEDQIMMPDREEASSTSTSASSMDSSPPGTSVSEDEQQSGTGGKSSIGLDNGWLLDNRTEPGGRSVNDPFSASRRDEASAECILPEECNRLQDSSGTISFSSQNDRGEGCAPQVSAALNKDARAAGSHCAYGNIDHKTPTPPHRKRKRDDDHDAPRAIEEHARQRSSVKRPRRTEAAQGFGSDKAEQKPRIHVNDEERCDHSSAHITKHAKDAGTSIPPQARPCVENNSANVSGKCGNPSLPSSYFGKRSRGNDNEYDTCPHPLTKQRRIFAPAPEPTRSRPKAQCKTRLSQTSTAKSIAWHNRLQVAFSGFIQGLFGRCHG